MRSRYAAAIAEFQAFLRDRSSESFEKRNISGAIAKALLRKIDQWQAETRPYAVFNRLLEALYEMQADALVLYDNQEAKTLPSIDGGLVELPDYYKNLAHFTEHFRYQLEFARLRTTPLWMRKDAGVQFVQKRVPNWASSLTEERCANGEGVLYQILGIKRSELNSSADKGPISEAIGLPVISDEDFQTFLWLFGFDPLPLERMKGRERQLGALWWRAAQKQLALRQ